MTSSMFIFLAMLASVNLTTAEVCTRALCLPDDYKGWILPKKPDVDKSAGKWVIMIDCKVYLWSLSDLSCWNLGL